MNAPADIPARAAMRDYARLFDQLAELQQRHKSSIPGLAREAGRAAFMVMRAHAAEANNPEPRGTVWHNCPECNTYRFRSVRPR